MPATILFMFYAVHFTRFKRKQNARVMMMKMMMKKDLKERKSLAGMTVEVKLIYISRSYR